MSIRNRILVLAVAGAMALSMNACKSKISDADLKAKVESVTASHPHVTASVKDRVVTLSGTVASEEEKTALAEAVKGVDSKQIQSIVNDVTIEKPVVIEVNTNDADLVQKVTDAVKDYPTVKADVKDGVITVTGTLEQSRIQPLKIALDALNPKKVDLKGITIK
ncbi:BON domain-containing protein [Sphingobacterium sp. MYb382]|uniref:BON domain-containing protein n=1 Tax=Sphingobacterium sp. MYb382 TaxID=2745278 RepID=UPI00309B64C4